MVKPTRELFNKWERDGMAVKTMRCDNGGENILLHQRMKSADWKLNTEVQYTARVTPQQNSQVEKKLFIVILL